MAVLNLIDRQNAKIALADLGITRIGASNTLTIGIPVGALLLRLAVQTETAFNSATTTTLTVGDGTTTFASAVDIKTTGAETVSNTPKFYASGGTLTITLAETGATATAGRAFVIAEYVVVGNGEAGIYSST